MPLRMSEKDFAEATANSPLQVESLSAAVATPPPAPETSSAEGPPVRMLSIGAQDCLQEQEALAACPRLHLTVAEVAPQASANILDLQRGGQDVMLINNAGQTTFRPQTDATTALTVMNQANSITVFDIDTTNALKQILRSGL